MGSAGCIQFEQGAKTKQNGGGGGGGRCANTNGERSTRARALGRTHRTRWIDLASEPSGVLRCSCWLGHRSARQSGRPGTATASVCVGGGGEAGAGRAHRWAAVVVVRARQARHAGPHGSAGRVPSQQPHHLCRHIRRALLLMSALHRQLLQVLGEDLGEAMSHAQQRDGQSVSGRGPSTCLSRSRPPGCLSMCSSSSSMDTRARSHLQRDVVCHDDLSAGSRASV